jgi:hypothetical protein
MKRVDVRNGSSRSLLSLKVTGGSPPLSAWGPYVISGKFGVLRERRKCVRQHGFWVSSRRSDGEWDEPTGDRRDDR